MKSSSSVGDISVSWGVLQVILVPKVDFIIGNECKTFSLYTVACLSVFKEKIQDYFPLIIPPIRITTAYPIFASESYYVLTLQ